MRFLRTLGLGLSVTSLAWLLASCAGQPTRYQRMQDEDPSVRIGAIVEAGEANDRQALPLLIDRLDDGDVDVRIWAKMALERMTGMTMDYQPFESPAQRQAAIARWRQWLLSQPARASRPAAAASEPVPAAPSSRSKP